MELLDNPIRPYAWGSRTVLAELLGHESPAPHPQAEMWLGAHPGDPSRLQSGGTLLDALRADPDGLLGADRARKWDGTLPFLLKVLAADEPLSLQAHPSLDQARVGFEREERAGLARDAADRNYRDPNHKPELICALTEFHALVGFRSPDATVEFLRELAVPELDVYVQLLAGQPDADGLRALFTTWITLPQALLDTLVPALQAGCVRVAAADGPFRTEARTVLELSERYPGDAGVLAALLLNRITLAPGEAVYLPAGNLHAYLEGAGIEVMASSDNVLRGGLTPKHVDVPELLRVLDFAAAPPPVLTGTPDGAWLRYETPFEEFLLRRLQAAPADDPVEVPDGGPRILLCTAGAACLRGRDGRLELRRGASAWLGAEDTGLTLEAQEEGTQLFLAGDALG
ncbi:mannose-6-phosphate isomerase, class I [Pseudonocardia sp. CA-107938]|uniref:mannose-6-phosphate isomerase, class I n=1 Tax=Pseudonocardia sp. CA-107938 TaxID=3240021 RepID=UPI003D8E2FFD